MIFALLLARNSRTGYGSPGNRRRVPHNTSHCLLCIKILYRRSGYILHICGAYFVEGRFLFKDCPFPTYVPFCSV